MDINQFSLYSKISGLELTEQEEIDKALQEIYKIKKCQNYDEVIKYLCSNYGMRKDACLFYISKNVPVKISNNNNVLAIQISTTNKEFLYCYNKEN